MEHWFSKIEYSFFILKIKIVYGKMLTTAEAGW